MRIPRATYRLQLNAQFPFKAAEQLIDYFAELGVSDLYLSPINTAPPDSTHNYDVWDYEEINPALGGEEGLRSLAAAAKRRGIGLIVDFVPNHMGIAGNGNKWWRDVLKNGPASACAECFDVQWASEDGVEKVRLPVLGDFEKAVLDRGEIQIKGNELAYFESTFPIAEGSLVQNNPAETLRKQHYRLMHWRYGTEQINYRRFFEVNTLAGVAVERERVFDRTHAALLRLVADGVIGGIRLDHIDGLADPNAYLERLNQRLSSHPAYLLVEKILAPGERLPEAWKLQGTTGYDFLITVGQLFVDARAEEAFTNIYRDLVHERDSFKAVAERSKREVLRKGFWSEFAALTHSACRLAAAHPIYRDLSQPAIEGALEGLIVFMPVYRTYIECGKPLTHADRSVIEKTAQTARDKLPSYYQPAIDLVVGAWTTPCGGEEGDKFRTRLQQLTGPVMAKGIEDTAFYRYHRFIGLNEVGGEPDRFGISAATFHSDMSRRAKELPHSMLATSTHDTKFSEDARARLAALSEVPGEWKTFLTNLRDAHPIPGPTPNEEYRLIQALVGTLPYENDPQYRERARAFMLKSMREAKVNTSWHDPNADYEKRVHDYIDAVLESKELRKFVDRIAPFGTINSLSQTLLKLTCPGVPDIYQGNELWDFSMVDPDNRRPVDYQRQRRLLESMATMSAREAVVNWQTGAIKMKLIRDTLRFRLKQPDLFTTGDYAAVEVTGEHRERCVAFRRTLAFVEILVVVPRLTVALGFPALGPVWKDTRLTVDAGPFRNIFTGEILSGALDLAKVFAEFPVALLVKEGSG
jgi:(1->4)-alpha-D-glucan 1-alpha-D-glucosylmutase